MLYPQPPEVVFQAALRSLPRVGLTLVSTAPEQFYILAERGLNMWSNGENVGVYIKPSGAGSEVTVISKRKTATNIFAKDFTQDVHMALGAELGRMGQAVPAQQPAAQPAAPAKSPRAKTAKKAPQADTPAGGRDGGRDQQPQAPAVSPDSSGGVTI
jgi:hypothetical protein